MLMFFLDTVFLWLLMTGSWFGEKQSCGSDVAVQMLRFRGLQPMANFDIAAWDYLGRSFDSLIRKC